MATLTIDSLSITPKAGWPLDSTAGILASRSVDDPSNRIRFAPDGDNLPSSSTAGAWSGDPAVTVDFSPE